MTQDSSQRAQRDATDNDNVVDSHLDIDSNTDAATNLDAENTTTGDGNGIAQIPEAKIIITEESPDVVIAEIAPDTEPAVVVVATDATEAPNTPAAEQAELATVAELAEAELAANGLESEEQPFTNTPSPALEIPEGSVLELAGISAKSLFTPPNSDNVTTNDESEGLDSDNTDNTDNTSQLDSTDTHKDEYIKQELAKKQSSDHHVDAEGEDAASHTASDEEEDEDEDEEETEEEREQRKREEKLEAYKQFLAQQENEQKIDYSKVRVSIEANALPSKMYFLMNALSAIIASYGLVANSPAVVIGAMLVAMMLGPITGVALAIIDYRMPLLRKSLFTVAAGGALVVVIGFIVGLLHQGQPLTNEILSRTQPTSMDLMIALAGGTAGAYAMISPHLSVAVVGVAVATALVPPLAASGILLSNGEISLGLGALLLAMTNIIAIQFTNAMVLWFTGFRRLVDDDYKSGTYLTFFRRNAVTLLLLIGLGIYLTLNLNTIAKQQQFETNVKTNINDYFIDKGNVLTNTQFEKYDGYQTIRAVVRGETVPTSYDVRQIEAKITKDMDENFPKYLPVKLQLRYLPIKVIEANPLIKDKLDETDAAILNN
jgi:uncharacterized hydrophobic protein (TIGR00271 family)